MSNAAGALFALLDRELWLVTAAAGGRRGGLIATFVSQASLVAELPRVFVGLAKQHHTWELVEASDAFALHLLTEDHLGWVWRFGTRTGHQFDKFEGLAYQNGVTGSPLLPEVPGWLDCRVEARLDTGDRTIYLAEVVDSAVKPVGPLLTVQRLLNSAPAGRLRELQQQVVADSAVDAEAIRAWRQQRAASP
jgi:flavin reductase (DIM6/NTAB) family NADH-FMN oxidoreductase RutF